MLLELPNELLIYIISFIPPCEVITALSFVHSHINLLINDDLSWRTYVEYRNAWKLFSYEVSAIEGWKEEFKRRWRIEDNWMNGKFRSHQLLSHTDSFASHGNFLAHVQFPKLIKCIHFEDSLLATAANDNLIKLWDVNHPTQSNNEPRQPFATLKGHTSLIQHMQFHHRVLVSGSLDGINLWNMEDGTCLKVLHENERCYQLQFEEDLLLHGYTFGFKAWDINTLQLLKDVDGQFSITCLAFKSKKDRGIGNGWLMACATHWGDVALWDLRSFKCLQTMKSSAYQIHISGEILAVAGDGGVEIYDLRTNTLQHVLHFDQDVTAIHLKGEILLVGCTDGFVRVWNIVKMRELTIVAPQLDRFIGFLQTDWEHLVIKSNFNVGICDFRNILGT